MNLTAIEKRIRRDLPKELRNHFTSAPDMSDPGWMDAMARFSWAMMQQALDVASAQDDPFDAQAFRREALQWSGELRKLKYLELQKDNQKRPGALDVRLVGFGPPGEDDA